MNIHSNFKADVDEKSVGKTKQERERFYIKN